MIRLLAIAALCLLTGCEQAPDLWTAGYCKLYPSQCVVPLPPERPVIDQPAPPVATPAVVAPAPQPKAAKPRLKPKPSPAVRRAPKETGPDLPYPCWVVRWHAKGKTPAQMDAMAKANGVKLTPKQERQARACLR